MLLRAVLGLFMITIFPVCALASSSEVVCSEVTAKVVERGKEERTIDSCSYIKDCFQKPDGTYAYQRDFTRLEIMTSSGETSCPKPGTIFYVEANIPGKKVMARVIAWTAMGPNGVVSGVELDDIRSLDGKPQVGRASENTILKESD